MSPSRLCVFAVILLPTIARAGELPAQLQDSRAKIIKQIEEGNLPSLAVAVARDGKIIWEEGFGLADRESGRQADEHTMYSLASISKPITTTGLMILVERGKVDLDRPIDDYLGGAKVSPRVGHAADATVRRVANHTAGLPLHYQFFYVDEPGGPPSPAETIARYANLYTPPGERYQYSNLGYGMLDYVIQQQSGKPYAQFMREEVFAPLGLDHMSIDIPEGMEDQTATRYAGNGDALPFYTFDHPGASAVFASAHDLVRFGMFHVKTPVDGQSAILSEQAIDKMQRPTAATDPGRGRSGYGIGWGTSRNRRGYTLVSHTGGMPGVATILLMVPAERLVVVALANGPTNLPGNLAHAIVDQLLPDEADPAKQSPVAPEEKVAAQEEPADANGGGDGEAAKKKDAKQPEWADLAGEWKGEVATYQGAKPLRLTIDAEGKVEVQLNDAAAAPLSEANLRNGVLRGDILGELGTDDSRRLPGNIFLELRLVEGKLQGKAIVFSNNRPRGGNALTHWVELTR
ncbi:MAG: beta-lactamase family protein [Pirellulales bacterium]|nr:beta-lactamase family protein [Pirellulales bacterium]